MSAASPHIVAAAERISASEGGSLREAEALVDVALDLQRKPKDPQQLIDAIFLYDRAASLVADVPLAKARAIAGKGTALRRMPGAGLDQLLAAREAFEEALPALRGGGEPEEVAEIEMNYGLVLQALAGEGRAPLPDAIAAYHRALRCFDAVSFPREYAILHNNLATAYLSMAMLGGKEGIREALAVQSFREALRCVTREEDPVEWSMLQNNLGNALQATRTSHPFESLLEAVAAYDAALSVRTARDMPIEHANTIANKANALMNLPDDPAHLDKGNPDNLAKAAQLLEQAGELFSAGGLADRAGIVRELAGSLRRELAG